MNDTLKIILFSSAAGLPIFVGGLLSSIFQDNEYELKEHINCWITAFGGGALLSAIAFVLIPKAVINLAYIPMAVIFLGGTVTFMFLDILSRVGGSSAQLLSMMMDFIPEALALGASFAHDHKFGLLVAMFIGLQNLPEGFNSYVELNKKMKKKNTLFLMFGLSFIGIIASLSGEFFLGNNAVIIDSIMLFAGGGILYLIFQDIAPLSRKTAGWLPASGASVGFLLGMIGEKLLQ